jgi:hypothetical protein
MEPALMLLAVLFVLSQIAWPAYKDTPTFPLIRRIFKHKRMVEEKVRELKTAKEVKKLEKTAEALEAELREPKKRKSAKP